MQNQAILLQIVDDELLSAPQAAVYQGLDFLALGCQHILLVDAVNQPQFLYELELVGLEITS